MHCFLAVSGNGRCCGPCSLNTKSRGKFIGMLQEGLVIPFCKQACDVPLQAMHGPEQDALHLTAKDSTATVNQQLADVSPLRT